MRQHSMANSKKIQELVHECNVQLALFRCATQGIGTAQDGASLRREVETAGRACQKAVEAANTVVLPQLRADAQQTPKTPKTPKISKEEREKLKKEKQEEKERQRTEKERILEEKRAEKEKLAEEKRLEKEKREKEKLEKKLEEDRKREEKKREIEERKKKEEEEKLRKEEEKNKKKLEEEEKKEAKRKEEEEKKEAKRKEEEALEARKKRQSEKFLGFFSKVEKRAPVEPPVTSSTWYRPFQQKDGMTMAPILPRKPLDNDFDIFEQNDEINSLSEFLNSATKLEKPKQNDMKAKFYQFHENRRPPYYGTWRKKSTIIRGWTPFAEETGIDYEVDSDNEWEDEPSDCEECNSDDDAVPLATDKTAGNG
uniref:Chromatin assembly factor 1 subunit A dimerization domain-containing protein n=2 Tax=Caenorhabditis japonica TaxID=281687 RepID=A0A8R1IU27_CAEJA